MSFQSLTGLFGCLGFAGDPRQIGTRFSESDRDERLRAVLPPDGERASFLDGHWKQRRFIDGREKLGLYRVRDLAEDHVLTRLQLLDKEVWRYKAPSILQGYRDLTCAEVCANQSQLLLASSSAKLLLSESRTGSPSLPAWECNPKRMLFALEGVSFLLPFG